MKFKLEYPKEKWDSMFANGKWDYLIKGQPNLETLATIIKHIEKSEIRVLDLGCGNGGLAVLLADDVRIKYTGIDISQVALDKAKSLYPKGRFICGNLDENPIPGGEKFDIVVLGEILYYVSWQHVVIIARQALASDGELLVSLYRSWRNIILFLMLKILYGAKTLRYVRNTRGLKWIILRIHK